MNQKQERLAKAMNAEAQSDGKRNVGSKLVSLSFPSGRKEYVHFFLS